MSGTSPIYPHAPVRGMHFYPQPFLPIFATGMYRSRTAICQSCRPSPFGKLTQSRHCGRSHRASGRLIAVIWGTRIQIPNARCREARFAYWTTRDGQVRVLAMVCFWVSHENYLPRAAVRTRLGEDIAVGLNPTNRQMRLPHANHPTTEHHPA